MITPFFYSYHHSWAKRISVKLGGSVPAINPTLKVLICILLIYVPLIAKCQETYNVKISLRSGDVVRGLLMKVTNDSITVTNRSGSKMTSVAVLDIVTIGIRNSEAAAVGTTTGAALGAIAGAVILNLTVTKSSGTPAIFTFIVLSLGGVIIGTPTGSLIGYSIGSHRKKFRLGTDPDDFDRFLKRLEEIQFTSPEFKVRR